MSTQSQFIANRANAQLSTGPTTEAGKAKVSLNAVKSGLTGRTIVLPSESAAEYENLITRLANRLAPATEEEKYLVQSIADTEWRLARIPGIESGIYAKGRYDAETLTDFTDTETYLQYQRSFNNLSIQENCLRRMREKDLSRLTEIQTARAEQEAKVPKPTGPSPAVQAIALFNEAKAAAASNPKLDASEIGFDFSTSPTAQKIED